MSLLKKALFITNNTISASDGVSKKILSQCSAIEGHFYSVDFVCSDENGLCWRGANERANVKLPKFKKYFLFYEAKKLISFYAKQYDVVYVRNPHGGFYSVFLCFLLKNFKNNNTKVYLEIPTYPYDKEIRGFKGHLSNFVYKLSKFFFLKYIDSIVYMGEPVEQIWGKPCIRVANGVACSDININPNIEDIKLLSSIEFIAVARLENWHGYDRFIYGLFNYYNDNQPKKKVILHIVGDNEPCLSQLKNLANKLGVANKVIFHGALSGVNLDRVFSRCQIAIDALGRHRTGNNFNSSLKSKEYTARGIHFIKSHIDDSFDKCLFVYNCPADDTAIDVNEIISWFERNYQKPQIIREYAEKELSWTSQFNFLKNNE